MASIRGRHTTPERKVRIILRKLRVRFSAHDMQLPGTPDFVLREQATVVFVHGCFWHRHSCARGTIPKTRKEFWQRKLEENRKRDSRQRVLLRKMGGARHNCVGMRDTEPR